MKENETQKSISFALMFGDVWDIYFHFRSHFPAISFVDIIIVRTVYTEYVINWKCLCSFLTIWSFYCCRKTKINTINYLCSSCEYIINLLDVGQFAICRNTNIEKKNCLNSLWIFHYNLNTKHIKLAELAARHSTFFLSFYFCSCYRLRIRSYTLVDDQKV